MSDSALPPDFARFTQWLAKKFAAPVSAAASPGHIEAAAHQARDEFLRTAHEHGSGGSAPPERVGRLETLQLLAAADQDESGQPPQMTTARGFRVTLAYDEGKRPGISSICVLVQCPSELIASVQGETAYLWSGTERFELGQFDADGKAIGTLPAGIEITLTDFKAGRIQLEEPDAPSPE